jgi:DNA-binding NarL/FixJ family response regulator
VLHPSPGRVLVVDDHPVVCAGLRLLLEDDPAFTVCGEAGDVTLAQRQVAELKPHFVVLDLVLGGRDGAELIEDLLVLEPTVRILVYSSQPEQPWARRAIRAGARGYVGKTCGLDVVRRALEAVAAGEVYLSDAAQRSLVNDYAAGRVGRSPLDLLSTRELQVFRLLGTGLGSAAVAAELRVSMRTVGTYRERLKNKLGAQSARELERCAEQFVRTGKWEPALR